MTQRRNAAGDPVDENGLAIAEDRYAGATHRDILGSTGAGFTYGLIITSVVLYIIGLVCRWWDWESGILPALLIGTLGTTLLTGGRAIWRAMK